MTTLKTKKLTIEKIKNGWTSDEMTSRAEARNATGSPVSPKSKQAVKFCAMGALWHFSSRTTSEAIYKDFLIRYQSTITNINDVVGPQRAKEMLVKLYE